ncbi:MAG: hypothetical protein ACRDP3_19660 [Streptomyces sp.]|uniref:hypothetical protein n=1 Tax=Streptomyces sp. TaxID=1931 RepID=UPI003D6A490D
MFRHVIAPARFFSRVPNEIIRHPRLSSDSVRLLAWQLSLPDGADEPLSKSARRAGIKRTAYQNAKRQLIAEGYLHEWRRQGEGGHWRTHQLISNVALTAEEARAAWNPQYTPATPTPTTLTAPAPTTSAPTAQAPTTPAPAATSPTIGQPTGRSRGSQQPRKNTREKTPHPPASPLILAEAEALLLSLGRTEPRLAMSARKAARWAPFAAQWFARDVPPTQIREVLIQGLGTARSPLGALRWRLEHSVPDAPTAPAPPPTTPRVALMRECEGGGHDRPRLFSPSADETECPGCLSVAEAGPPRPRTEGPGFRAYLATRARTAKVPATA